MKYWFVHVILIGALVSIWVPTLSDTTSTYESSEEYMYEDDYQSNEYTESLDEYYSMMMEDSTYDDSNNDKLYSVEPWPTPTMGSSEAESTPILSVIISNLKELMSLIIAFGNVMTFTWQWRDRKNKKQVTA